MLITSVERRRGRLDAVYLDGAFAACLDRELLQVSGYRTGSEISQQQMKTLCRQSDEKRAKEKALWLLSHRDHTRTELLEKISRTLPARAAEQAVERMEELGMLDDAGFARRTARELAGKQYARPYILRALLKKGIDPALARTAVDELEDDPSDQIRVLLEGRLRHTLAGPNGKDRAITALRRCGFTWEEIRPGLVAFMKQAEGDNFEEERDAACTQEPGVDEEASDAQRIAYLLETKYMYSLGSEKDRKRTINALIARGFSRLQTEEAVRAYCDGNQRGGTV